MIQFEYQINEPQVYRDIERIKDKFNVEVKFINDTIIIQNNRDIHSDLTMMILELGYNIIQEARI